MKRSSLARAGFSLVEVSITLGIMAFALVGLIGLMPFGLEQTRASMNETRGAHLARMVCATLEGELYMAARCFGAPGSALLDFSTMTATTAPVVLYASYDVLQQAKIVRSDVAPAEAEYRIELRFQPAPLSTASTPSPVRGHTVNVKITAYPAQKSVVFEGVEFLSRLQRSTKPL
jgi:hypothetical protein